MSISVDNTVMSISTSAGSSRTWSHTVAPGVSILIVGITLRVTSGTTATVSSVKYNGIDLTRIVTAHPLVNRPRCELWYLLNPPSGANNVVATWSAGSQYSAGFSESLFGVDAISPIGDAQAKYNTTTVGDTGNLTMDSADGERVYTVASHTNTTDGMTPVGTGHSAILTGSNGGAQVGMGYAPGAASLALKWDWANVYTYAFVACCVKPALSQLNRFRVEVIG